MYFLMADSATVVEDYDDSDSKYDIQYIISNNNKFLNHIIPTILVIFINLLRIIKET